MMGPARDSTSTRVGFGDAAKGEICASHVMVDELREALKRIFVNI